MALYYEAALQQPIAKELSELYYSNLSCLSLGRPGGVTVRKYDFKTNEDHASFINRDVVAYATSPGEDLILMSAYGPGYHGTFAQKKDSRFDVGGCDGPIISLSFMPDGESFIELDVSKPSVINRTGRIRQRNIKNSESRTLKRGYDLEDCRGVVALPNGLNILYAKDWTIYKLDLGTLGEKTWHVAPGQIDQMAISRNGRFVMHGSKSYDEIVSINTSTKETKSIEKKSKLVDALIPLDDGIHFLEAASMGNYCGSKIHLRNIENGESEVICDISNHSWKDGINKVIAMGVSYKEPCIL